MAEIMNFVSLMAYRGHLDSDMFDRLDTAFAFETSPEVPSPLSSIKDIYYVYK